VVLQSREDIEANGTGAQTYMLCSGGFCGVNPIPEPSPFTLMIAGGGRMDGLARAAIGSPPTV
jgi:hypothetical protein